MGLLSVNITTYDEGVRIVMGLPCVFTKIERKDAKCVIQTSGGAVEDNTQGKIHYIIIKNQ